MRVKLTLITVSLSAYILSAVTSHGLCSHSLNEEIQVDINSTDFCFHLCVCVCVGFSLILSVSHAVASPQVRHVIFLEECFYTLFSKGDYFHLLRCLVEASY